MAESWSGKDARKKNIVQTQWLTLSNVIPKKKDC